MLRLFCKLLSSKNSSNICQLKCFVKRFGNLCNLFLVILVSRYLMCILTAIAFGLELTIFKHSDIAI